MSPLVDVHCHLLAGLDDGPRTAEDALAMCRLAHAAGTRIIAAGAHQNEQYPDNTPERIRTAAVELHGRLRAEKIELTTFPCAEVMVTPDMDAAWQRGELLSVADHRQYLLVEYPHGQFVDLGDMVQRFTGLGLRFILAHPERCPELLHDEQRLADLIRGGCLVQVSAHSVTRPRNRLEERRLRHWFHSELVHLLGSDGHDPQRRRPEMADAYRQIVHWVGSDVADRIASVNGMAVSQGLVLRPPLPRAKARSWFFNWW